MENCIIKRKKNENSELSNYFEVKALFFSILQNIDSELFLNYSELF